MRAGTSRTLEQLASQMVLGALLNEVRARWGDFDLVDHWQQGEFHHDTVLRLQSTTGDLPGDFIVVATNCNGGVKEVLCFSELPTHSALWKFRYPESEEFQGELPQILGRATTQHFFDPCDLLRADARSEYRAEYRQRQLGGGWKLKKAGSCGT